MWSSKHAWKHGPAHDLCEKLFDRIDTDGGGYLVEEEAKVFLRITTGESDPAELHDEWLELLKATDEDGNGQISKVEFLGYMLKQAQQDEQGAFVDIAYVQYLEEQNILLGAAAKLCGRLFDVIDTDGSGHLEEAQAKVFLRGCICCKASEVDLYYTELRQAHDDTSVVGHIFKHEFLVFVLGKEQLDESGGVFLSSPAARSMGLFHHIPRTTAMWFSQLLEVFG
jgi:hypothetical protein